MYFSSVCGYSPYLPPVAPLPQPSGRLIWWTHGGGKEIEAEGNQDSHWEQNEAMLTSSVQFAMVWATASSTDFSCYLLCHSTSVPPLSVATKNSARQLLLPVSLEGYVGTPPRCSPSLTLAKIQGCTCLTSPGSTCVSQPHHFALSSGPVLPGWHLEFQKGLKSAYGAPQI